MRPEAARKDFVELALARGRKRSQERARKPSEAADIATLDGFKAPCDFRIV